MERGDEHVQMSYVTPLDAWFRAMKIFTVLSLFESVAVLALIRATRAIVKFHLSLTFNHFYKKKHFVIIIEIG